MFHLEKENEHIAADVRATLSEHFSNFMFIVLDDKGNLYYECTNNPVGQMLLKEAKKSLDSSDIESSAWEWLEEETDEKDGQV